MTTNILDNSRIRKLLFLGPKGSYSDFAKNVFIKAFDINCVSTNLKSISGIIKALKDENSEDIVAVIPIENSIEGIVRETLDNLSTLKEYKIIAETTLNIEHALVGFAQSFREIKTVRSHPQALAQCKRYLQANFSDSLIEEATLSTSAAIKSIKEDESKIVAIGSPECAKLYNIPVIAEHINDEENNQTRFILIGKFQTEITDKDKTSITFSTENKPGALNKILTILEKYKLNMSYIDSRPSKKELGEYVFYIDFEGHQTEKQVINAINEIKPYVKMFNIMGSYSNIVNKM